MNEVFNNKDYEIMGKFYTERNINQRTQYGYNNSFSLYVQYTKMHLYDLLMEADIEEEKGVRWKKSKLKEKLIGFRNSLAEKYKYSTIKVLFNRIKTFYTHFEIEIGFIPQLNQKATIKSEPITYDDIPSKEMLHECLDYADYDWWAICDKENPTERGVSGEDVVDLLNELHEENKRLKAYLVRYVSGVSYDDLDEICNDEILSEWWEDLE